MEEYIKGIDFMEIYKEMEEKVYKVPYEEGNTVGVLFLRKGGSENE